MHSHMALRPPRLVALAFVLLALAIALPSALLGETVENTPGIGANRAKCICFRKNHDKQQNATKC